MGLRPLIHGSAIVAILFVAATWDRHDTVLEIPRAVAFSIVVAYLFYVLGSICYRRPTPLIVRSVGLWDPDLDGMPIFRPVAPPDETADVEGDDWPTVQASPEIRFIEPEPRRRRRDAPAPIMLSEIANGVLVRFPIINAIREFQDGESELHQPFRELESYQHVIIDFEGVEFLNAYLLGRLVLLHRKLREHDGDLILTGLSPTVVQVLRITRLATVFRVAETLEDALR